MLGVFFCSQLFGQLPTYIVEDDSQTSHKPLTFKEVTISGKTHNTLGLSKSTNQNTEDHLIQINGLSLVRRGNYAAEPVFRGLNANQTAVTIDGMKIFGACTDRMDPATSYVAPDNLGEACMDQSGDCNASCNMASLDLRTRNLQTGRKSVEGALRTGYNSNANNRVVQGEISFSNNKNALRIQSYYNKANNYTAGGGQEVLFSQFEKWNGVFHFKHSINSNTSLELKYIVDRAYNIGYPALPMDVSFAGGDILSFDLKTYINKGALKSLKIKLYGNHIEHIMDDTKRPNVVIHMDMPGISRTYGSFAIAEFVKGKHRIKIKPEYFLHRAYAEMTMYPAGEAAMFMLTWPDVYRQSALLSAFHSFKIKQRLDWTNSMQIEQQAAAVKSAFGIKQLQAIGYTYEKPVQRQGAQVKSELGFHFSSTQRSSLKVSLTQRTPQVSEAFGYYLYNSLDQYDYMGNPDIKNEKSVHIELSHAVNLNKTKFTATLFHYCFKDYIMGINSDLDAMTIGAKGVRNYANINSAIIQGLEVAASVDMGPNATFKSQTAYNRGYDYQKNSLPLIPALKTTNQLHFKVRETAVNFQYTYSAQQNKVAEMYGESITASYQLIDLTIRRSFTLNKNSLLTSFSVRNMLDANYVDHLDWNKIPRPGRSFDISLKYLF